MKKLWQKNNKTMNSFIEYFETKDDLALDQKLIPYDLRGSAAHAKMLCKIGIIKKSELNKLEEGLSEIQSLLENGKFNLQFGDEDMHTKIENYLIENYGEVGKKIHTGRSRNDQVLTAIRLYSKTQIQETKTLLEKLIHELREVSKEYGNIPMPGYTHMQKAMPSSIKLWIESFIESFEDDMKLLESVYALNDQSPLGAAAGFSTPLTIDRKFSSKQLGFNNVQNNSLYVVSSRGKIEAATVSALIQILMTINKIASDVLLFTTSEFHFFEVADELTSGSSIMPQKKNVDVAELLRSKVHIVLGNYTQLVSLSTNLISGYNRDLQDSKKPLMESFEITIDSLKATQLLLAHLKPIESNLKNAMTKDLFAAERAFELVKKGVPFRKAYQYVAKQILKGGEKNEKNY